MPAKTRSIMEAMNSAPCGMQWPFQLTLTAALNSPERSCVQSPLSAGSFFEVVVWEITWYPIWHHPIHQHSAPKEKPQRLIFKPVPLKLPSSCKLKNHRAINKIWLQKSNSGPQGNFLISQSGIYHWLSQASRKHAVIALCALHPWECS